MPDGTVKRTHTTYGFFDGQPAYDTIRQQIIEIANGSRGAMSKTEHSKSQ